MKRNSDEYHKKQLGRLVARNIRELTEEIMACSPEEKEWRRGHVTVKRYRKAERYRPGSFV